MFTRTPKTMIGRLSASLDEFLYRAFAIGAPIVIAALTLLGLLLNTQPSPTPDRTLAFSTLEDVGGQRTPAQALAELDDAATEHAAETHLSESPFWLLIKAGPEKSPRSPPVNLLFPSRHVLSLECWDAKSLQPLGRANRNQAGGRLGIATTGFTVNAPSTDTALLCRSEARGPARLTVERWSDEQLALRETRFARNAGLLDGGLFILTAFVLTAGIINRQWLYALFAAWLIANLRLAALSAGWDAAWFGVAIPTEWLFPLRQLTMASYFILTYLLFSRLFRRELRQINAPRSLTLLLWSGPPLLMLALVLPYARFLPIMWTVTTLGVLIVGYLLTRLISVTRSRVAMWYLGSLAVALLANLSEVIGAALDLRGSLSSLNSVTAALASSLLAALAIAEQMRQEREHRLRAQADLRQTYEAMPIGLFTLDARGDFVHTNPALRAMLALPRAPCANWRTYFGESGWLALQAMLDEPATRDLELRRREKSAPAATWHLIRATRVKGRIEGSMQDITARVAATTQLQFLADHDPLTGILNRRGIEAAYSELVDGGKRLALAYIDLTRFKLINDLFGHVAGDEVLRQVCHRIHSHLSPGQRLGRVGGDEFVILCGRGLFAHYQSQLRSVLAAIEEAPYQMGDRAFQIRASAGIVDIVAGTGCTDAISLAERACRQAKLGPPGQVVAFEKDAPAFSERAAERDLLQRLDRPRAPDGLFLLMQPIIALADPYGSLNFEVLLRMRDEHNNIIPAGRLIGAAERNGRIAAIDRWVLKELLTWLDLHRAKLPATQFVCMNLSGGSLNDERFIQDAFAILAEHPQVSSLLCIEITESVALHDLANTRRFIDGVRKHGARIALDDFGAGYTSFSYLKELPAELLKIDGEFVRGVASHPADLSIVEAIVQLARNLGMRSLAEWAEDQPTMEALASVGVDFVQGYAVARPMLPEKLLTGSSAASFIEDPAVSRFVREDLLRASRTGLTFTSDSVPFEKLH